MFRLREFEKDANTILKLEVELNSILHKMRDLRLINFFDGITNIMTISSYNH
jgi:hypothetical protein